MGVSPDTPIKITETQSSGQSKEGIVKLDAALSTIRILQEENEALKAQITALTAAKRPRRDLLVLVKLLIEAPRTVPELSLAMEKETRLVSQWLHSLKTRYNANIYTLADGKKALHNAEEFKPWIAWLDEPQNEAK